MYVNCEKREGSTPLDLLLQDFFIKNPARMNNEVLADRVSTVKGRRENKMAVPSFEDVYQEGRTDGIGRAEALLANLRRLTVKLNMTVEEAMECLEVPQEEREHYAALLKN